MTTPADHVGPTADDESGEPISMLLSRERLNVDTEWVETGRLRLHRRVVSETRTIEVTVRREELVVEGDNVEVGDGVTVGTLANGPVSEATATAGEPLVIALREEVPQILMQRRDYERVTVHVDRVAGSVQLTDALRREDIAVDTTGTPGMAAQ